MKEFDYKKYLTEGWMFREAEKTPESTSQVYTMRGMIESGPGGLYQCPEEYEVMFQNPDFSKDGDDFIYGLVYKPVNVGEEDVDWTDDWADWFEEFTPLEIFDKSGKKVWENNDPYVADLKDSEKYKKFSSRD